MSRHLPGLGLIGALALATTISACGKDSKDKPAVTPKALTITGTLGQSGGTGGTRAFVPSSGRSEDAVVLSELLVSCVTFTVPPVAGDGGIVSSAGLFTITFPVGTVGSNFGCFISSPTDASFDPIPMVFVDSTKKGLNGEPSKTTRLAVTSSIRIPMILLDAAAGTAEVDVGTIENSDTGSTTNIVQVATGTMTDFTGVYVIEDAAASNITLPTGYTSPCLPDAIFESNWASMTSNGPQGKNGCNGPMIGMKLFLQRYAGKSFTPDAACVAAQLESRNGTGPVTTCNGTVGTEPRFAISMWANQDMGGGDLCQVHNPALPGDDTKASCKVKFLARINGAAAPNTLFQACGRHLGFTNAEARAAGQIDLLSDPNYLATGESTGPADAHYYEGVYPFASSVTLTDPALFGTCTPGGMGQCKPFAAAVNTITDGWKLSEAQLTFAQQNNCGPVPLLVGTIGNLLPTQGWRCFGDFYPNCTENPPMACTNTSGVAPAFQENADLGCTDAAGKPVKFGNWNDFFCQPPDSSCTCSTSGEVFRPGSGGPVAAGYTVQACTGKSGFVPKDQNGNALTGLTGTVTCRSGGGLFDASTVTAPVMITISNPWQKFRAEQDVPGKLCSEMVSTSSAVGADLDRLKLAQLQCYAQAYQQASRALSGCTRDVRFNWGTENPYDFVASSNGPQRARGQMLLELFTYADPKSGSFSLVEARMEGVQTQDARGNMQWVPCRINESSTITVSTLSDTKLLVELTMVLTLVNKDNAACVAAAADGQLQTGTQKQLFVMTKLP